MLFRSKLFSAIRLCRLALPHMRAQRWGRIINIVNTLAKTPGAGSAPTSVSRAAGIAFTKVLANEVATHNILVNAICVGRIDSEQWRRFHSQSGSALSYEDYLAEQGRAIPLGRMGRPDEFASLLSLLASEAGGYITGTAINVDAPSSIGQSGDSSLRTTDRKCAICRRYISSRSRCPSWTTCVWSGR